MELKEFTDEEGNYYKYKLYDGRPYHPLVKGNVKDQLQLLDNYNFTDEDVFLCLFPKSGTHWLYSIITMLRTGSVKYSCRHVTLEIHDISKLDGLEPPRTFVTHMTYDILPSAIKRGVGKIVYVMRNPKDGFVSYKYFLDSLKPHVYSGNIDGFLRMFLSDESGCGVGGSWFTHTREWDDWKQSNTEPIHTVIYEELKKNTYKEIEKLAQFLEIDYDDTFLENVVKNITFDKLKAEHATEAGATEQWTQFCKDGRLPIYRKGIIGDWKNNLTVSQNELFDAMIQEKLSGHNIDLIYE